MSGLVIVLSSHVEAKKTIWRARREYRLIQGCKDNRGKWRVRRDKARRKIAKKYFPDCVIVTVQSPKIWNRVKNWQWE